MRLFKNRFDNFLLGSKNPAIPGLFPIYSCSGKWLTYPDPILLVIKHKENAFFALWVLDNYAKNSIDNNWNRKKKNKMSLEKTPESCASRSFQQSSSNVEQAAGGATQSSLLGLQASLTEIFAIKRRCAVPFRKAWATFLKLYFPSFPALI